jgi:site-specific DNA-methyltransferase (adenine-specific)
MKLIHSDCIAAMKEMPDNSVDSVVTDPPYELGFMGKSWDSSGIAFNVEVWQEALRVLKPGGHLIAFSGSRTYHRMAVAIEDAGFQIRDQIMWIYGSGFPKSHNISKAIDKTNGVTNEWEGWGTALKPAHEPMVLARKPLLGTVADNVLTYGTGGLNIDGSRVLSQDSFEGMKGFASMKLNARRDGESEEEWKFRCESGPEQQESLRKLKELGRFPANVIHDGSDEVLALFPDTKSQKSNRGNVNLGSFGGYADSGNGVVDGTDTVRGFNDSGSAARFFYCAKASKRDRNEGLDGFENKRPAYESHRPNYENTKGIETPFAGTGRGGKDFKNFHPTVKPTDLMRYLCRLITPPNGIVLDPFMGSGSTGKAAMLEGFDFIGIEQEIDYLKIAQARIEHAVVAQMAGAEE